MIQLGKSNLKISPLTFGAWAIGGWMWGGADRKDALRALDASIDVGVTTIDTAPVYGFGLSEEIVGDAIRDKKEKVQILTKCGLVWDKIRGEFHFSTTDNNGKPLTVYKYAAKESIIRECELSLRRLGVDVIDLYQLHWPDPTTSVDEPMEAFQLLLKQGKIKAAGVSNYNVELMKTAKGTFPIASNQLPYSMLSRDIEAEVIPYCIENQVGILAYSPLQRGLLTGKFTPEWKFNEGDSRATHPMYTPENITRVNQFLQDIRPIADKQDLTLSQLVICWTRQQPGISSVLTGVRNEKQVLENAKALHTKISDDDVAVINDHLEKLVL